MDSTPQPSIWRKEGLLSEERIYTLLGQHPRILAYLGHDPITCELLLQHLQNGDLHGYLSYHPTVSYKTRIGWAIEIVEGITHLHSNNIVWHDTHLGNVLVTDDLHVVLCDFGSSLINPPVLQRFEVEPPPPYVCPSGYYGFTEKRQDIFGFGVILFTLLSQRFPHCSGFSPDFDELCASADLHETMEFDALSEISHPHFAQIVEKCFRIRYQSASELLADLEKAHSSWIKDIERVCRSFLHVSAVCIGRLRESTEECARSRCTRTREDGRLFSP
jgi:serine/threonine protein kinase